MAEPAIPQVESIATDLDHVADALAEVDHPEPCGKDSCVYCWAEGVISRAAGEVRALPASLFDDKAIDRGANALAHNTAVFLGFPLSERRELAHAALFAALNLTDPKETRDG